MKLNGKITDPSALANARTQDASLTRAFELCVRKTHGNAQVTLNWNGVASAFGYNLKRSNVSGGPYVTIANAMAVTNCLDTNVANGIAYYYVVSAINTAGEGTNSPPAAGRPVSTASTPLNFTVGGGQLQFNWAQDHTGWMLQAQTNSLATGLANNWVTISNTASTNQVLFPIGSTNGSVFFRLIYQ